MKPNREDEAYFASAPPVTQVKNMAIGAVVDDVLESGEWANILRLGP
jgi:hypothetical protein